MKTIIFSTFLLIASLSLQAQTQLDTPVIDSISINPTTNMVNLAWHVKDTVPGMEYIIFRQIFISDPKFVKPSNTTVDNLGYYAIDTIRGTSLTMHYTDNVKHYYGVPNPLYHPVTYYIRSIAIGKSGGSIPCDPSSTMMLLPVVYDPCTNSNTLRWYSYPSWTGAVGGYDIFVKLDNAPFFTYLSSVKATDTTYSDKSIWPKTTYSYYVKCKNNDAVRSSSSNFVKSTTPPDSLPKTLNLDYVSVVNNNIKLSVTFDPTKSAKGYYILRGDSLNAKYDTLTSFKNSLSSPLIFNDVTADPSKKYYYKIMVKNACGIPYKTTDVSTNMILYATAGIGGPNLNHLDWDPYKYWAGGVMGYKIYRSLDGGSPSLVNSVGSTAHIFDDDVSTLKQGSGSQAHKICYYIEADEGNSGTSPVIANSNTVCISLDSKIEMPNAFNPSSTSDINRVFKPGFDQADGYLMIIYDRWGFKIFQSSDPTIGWDGRNKDKNLVPEGVYVYYLTYMAGDNKIEQSGTVTVVATNN